MISAVTPHTGPRLSAVVVHWRSREHLTRLVDGWPRDPRFELVVVDNGGDFDELPAPWRDGPARLVSPGCNLGFGGGVNRGVAETSAPWVLVLNPDARPLAGALDALLDATAEFADAAGIVPALEGPAGESQCRWQLQPLPSPATLLAQTLFVAGSRGPRTEPARGTAVEQPAAAALLLRRTVLAELGGFDESFYPAWFEDVDLACRLRRKGHRLIFEPRARFVHALGSSLPALGYGPFLWVYYRNLARYLRRHHGAGWELAARATMLLGMVLRLKLLLFRRPSRAPSRSAAAAGLADVIRGASSGWRRPEDYALRFQPPTAERNPR